VSLDVDKLTQSQDIVKLEFQNEPSDTEFNQKLNLLKQNPEIKNIGLFFKRGDNAVSIGTSNIFYVKLKNISDFDVLQQTTISKGVQIEKQVPYMPEWYIISVNNPYLGTSLSLSNQFYETGLFADVDPAFMFNFTSNCSDDPMFGSLWGLNNSNNPGIDINVCDAWEITEGQGVKVAVLDTGVDLTHNDLQENIYNLSYDCQTGTSPSVLRPQFYNYKHGTRVAGIIGAVKDNGLQVVGVAPQSELMSISHSLSPTPNASL